MSGERSEEIAIGCSCGTGTCEDCAREMRAAIVAVRQLHRPVKPNPRGLEICNACSSVRVLLEPGKQARERISARGGIAYPCATIRVLDERGA